MSKVLITRSKLDDLATTIAAKSGATLPLTIAQMDAAVESIAPAPTLQSKSATPTESAQTVTPDSGYDGLSQVDIGAISSTYVGSGIDQRDSTDLTASGATVTVPAGYYAEQASKAVASGSAGTPTATKGTVSNHAVSVTPSVTNVTGYITGGTKTGTAVSVAASELVSGTYTVGASGTHDVTNYASASVASGGATASATKGSVSNHSVTVTPSVTRTAGYVTAGTASGTAVTVSASELVSGNKAIVENGTNIDVTDYATVSVNVSGGGSSSYTRTVVVPQQTVTPNSSRMATFTSTEYFVDGEYYVVTCDGTEYIVTSETLWSSNVVLGDAQVVWATSDVLYPFALITDGSAREGYFTTTSQHTIKVEKLEFVDGPLNLIAKSVTANGTYNASSDSADGYSSVTVNVSGGSSKNVQVAQSTTRVANTAYTKAASLTCSKAGTYDVYWDCFRSSTSGTSGSQLYIGGSAYGTANTTFASNIHAQNNHLTGVTLAANQEVAVYVRSRGTNYYAYCGQLTIVQTA